MQPRLTFVVPVYKPKPEIFEKCVKSLAYQALKEKCVIFVLDGPSMEARKIIAKYQAGQDFKTIEVLHGGAQKARNAGGALVDTEFVCFFDSDCVIEPGASQMWVEQFDKRPHVGLIYSGYKFFGDKYAIESEPFDPWTLRIRNYISGCFPMRSKLYPGWNESLESLQDWDLWLSVLEKAGKEGWDISKIGFYVKGYAFTTAFPDPESISGRGCRPDTWLSRMDAVKNLHNLPERNVCVSSLSNRHEGISLAKLIDADYLDVPNDKPHRYKTIIQIGFSLGTNSERHAQIFQEKAVKKFLFWTFEDINEIYHAISLQQIDAMATLLNDCVIQYVEDAAAKKLMDRAAFKTVVFPLPLGEAKEIPLPKEKKWAFDISGHYSPAMSIIDRSLPDIQLDPIGAVTNLKDYIGLIHFFPDKTLSPAIKRAHLTGRHVISNVQQPYCGFIDDKWDHEEFIIKTVDKIRALSNAAPKTEAKTLYAQNAEALKAVLA